MAREARDGGGGGRDRDRGRSQDRDGGDDLIDKLVTINRVAKVVKGGRRFAFAALVVVGDQKGRVGYGAGKAREVPEAIRKATERAKRGLDPGADEGRPHPASRRAGPRSAPGTWCCARPRPAPASSPAARCARCSRRSGIGDVVAKSLGSRNPHNMVKATFAALQRCASPRTVATRRGKKVVRHPRQARPGAGGGRGGGGRCLTCQAATVRVTQVRLGLRPQAGPARDPDRARPGQAAADARARGHALGARHDPQGGPPGAGGGQPTVKLNEIRDNAGRAPASPSGSAAASARARARPPARASRARRRARAWR